MQMAAILIEDRVVEAGLETEPALNVVVAYEDFATGKRAMHIYNRLVQEFQHEFRFTVNFWKFDILPTPKLLKMAAHEAAQADVVFISARTDGELPLEVKNWLRRWLVRSENSSVTLVALLEGKNLLAIESCPTRAYLQRVAERAGINFHAHGFITSKTHHKSLFPTVLEDDESQGFSLERILSGRDAPLEHSTAA
jgi:hypothetical protein